MKNFELSTSELLLCSNLLFQESERLKHAHLNYLNDLAKNRYELGKKIENEIDHRLSKIKDY